VEYTQQALKGLKNKKVSTFWKTSGENAVPVAKYNISIKKKYPLIGELAIFKKILLF